MMLTEGLKARVIAGTNERIKEKCIRHPDVYENLSHFVRCAIARELRRTEQVIQ